MKAFLFILSVLFLFPVTKGQDSLSLPNIYYSATLGAGPIMNNDGVSTALYASAGYQLHQAVGLGISVKLLGSWKYYSAGCSGVSIQYRMRPSKNLILRGDYGYIFSHSQGDIPYNKYLPGWYSFFEIYAGFKIGKLWTLGMGYVGLPQVKYGICGDLSADDYASCEPKKEQYYRWSISGLHFTIGISMH